MLQLKEHATKSSPAVLRDSRCCMMRHGSRLMFLLLVVVLVPSAWARGPGGQLRLEVVDPATGEPIACRMHLRNSAQRALKAPKVPFFHDHFVFDGSIALKLPEGEYAFEIERGPEYLVRSGHFTMQNFSDDRKVVELNRFVDMAKDGWWSGDLDVERPAKDLPLLMSAEDLHVVELVTWPGGKKLLPKTGVPDDPLLELSPGTFAHFAAARSSGPSGSLMLFNVPSPGEFFSEDRPKRNQIELIGAARREEQTWIDAREACGWDIPVLVAHGMLDSVELANGDLARKGIAAAKSTGGRPRDERLYPGPAGNARWNETIYYHLLNCGLRIPPTAGSGSGAGSNTLGYNRVYVHIEGELSYQKWFDGLRAGRVVVTNGPLIRPTVEGELPGHVFQASRGEEVELEVGLTLSTRDPISYLEIVKNGEPIQQVRLKEWERLKGKLPLVPFKESGWFLIRAVTDLAETHRFATTGPYYVEIGDRSRISKSSAQFFADWVDERVASIEQNGGYARDSEREFYRQARQFWKQKIAEANAP